MIEQMEKQMDAESAADQRQLRERILATNQLLRRLNDQYQEKFGAPPTPMNLDVREGVQFVADEQDAFDQIVGGVEQRQKLIEEYEAAGGFVDRDPDGMS